MSHIVELWYTLDNVNETRWNMKRWLLRRTKVDTNRMAQDLGIREATARVLANRGVVDPQQARIFLAGKETSFRDALTMKDMEKSIRMIKNAIATGKKITIYGDYDVDGVMSTVILYKGISACGGKVEYYLPHRQKEGYGLNTTAVEMLAEQGTELLFTCDNGIAALYEVDRAKELGMEVVILDHHEPVFVEEGGEIRELLPKADALIDPKQRACEYPFELFCAAGIAYRFVLALCQECSLSDAALKRELLVFAGIATVCDIVDLIDENRLLVRSALEAMEEEKNIGLCALLEVTELEKKAISEYHMGFIIGPCINAAGRLESAIQVVELFCTKDEIRAREIAKHLMELNNERKLLTQQAVWRAEEKIEAENILADSVFVIYDFQTHESVAGIVAGRIKDRYYRPVILLTDGEGGAKGSARSIEGYHVFEALLQQKDLFQRFGGHAMAAGLSLPHENISLLRERLNEVCALTEEQLTPILRIEKMLSLTEIDMHLANELKGLAPFGKENPSPLFASTNIVISRLDFVGKDKDILRMTLAEEKGSMRIQAISFDGYQKLKELLKELYPDEECDKIFSGGSLPLAMDFVYSIDINSYNGRHSVQLLIRDFRISK